MRPQTQSWTLLLCLTVTLACPGALRAQSDATAAAWAFRTRLVVSGNSDQSEPAGYTMYSGIGLEAALTRAIGSRFMAELGLRTESREIDRDITATTYERLGSLELLPINLTVQWRPQAGRSFDPYVGGGVNLTVAWEESGELDSLDIAPHVGPALQVGADVSLSRIAFLNFDLRWNTLTTELANGGTTVARLTVDPLTLGLGIGFRF